jgi:hypothetical protein
MSSNYGSIRAMQYVQKILTSLRVGSLAELPLDMQKEIQRQHDRIALEDVYGMDFKTDAKGRPIEQGIGAPGNETEQHFAAIEKYHGPEAARQARAAAEKRKAAAG